MHSTIAAFESRVRSPSNPSPGFARRGPAARPNGPVRLPQPTADLVERMLSARCADRR